MTQNLRHTFLLASLTVAGLTGCSRYQAVAQPDVMDPTPIAVDPAMEKRTWDQSTATYTRMRTVAGPTGLMFRPELNRPEWQYAFIDAPIFLGNVVMMPYVLVRTPPLSPVEYSPTNLEPTYTAMPPLPTVAASTEAPASASTETPATAPMTP